MNKDDALKLALEALELHGKQYPHMVKGYCLDAITAIKQALAAQQEPVATNKIYVTREQLAELYPPPAAQPAPVPDYAWPTVTDYEKDVGFIVNDTFKMAWNMARTTNDLFTQMGNT
jgi:hypothetical protein